MGLRTSVKGLSAAMEEGANNGKRKESSPTNLMRRYNDKVMRGAAASRQQSNTLLLGAEKSGRDSSTAQADSFAGAKERKKRRFTSVGMTMLQCPVEVGEQASAYFGQDGP